MRRSHTPIGRLAAAALTVATIASLAGIGVASAANSGTVTVSGTSQPKIELTVSSGTANLGTNLTPDGVNSNGDVGVTYFVEGSNPSIGACYRWPGSIAVRSNVGYWVSVSASGSNNRLDFLTANPGSYTDCTSGQQFAAAMFGAPPVDPAHAWLSGQGKTNKDTHPFWLGLDIRWMDDPGVVANQILTLTASATP